MKGEGIKTTSEARTIKGHGIKVLPSKQLMQKLLILLLPIQAGNTSKNLEAVAWRACNFIKKEILAKVFSCKFCEIFKNPFL